MAEKKLLAALPETLRSLLTKAEKLVGFEKTPNDIFHPEPASQEPPLIAIPQEQADLRQSKTISIFFRNYSVGGSENGKNGMTRKRVIECREEFHPLFT